MNSHEAQPNPPPVPNGASLIPEAGLSPSGAEVDPPFLMLDPRVIHLWRFQHLISSFVLLLFVLVGAGVVVAQYQPAWPWLLGAWLTLALVRAILLFWYPPRAYAAWGYRINDQVLETKDGIWFRTVTLLPLSRLQHVDLNRGPLERMFGLANLTLYTAGTHHASIEIPGLEGVTAAQLRDRLVALGGERAPNGV